MSQCECVAHSLAVCCYCLSGLDMLEAHRSRTRETPEEQSDACATEDVGIIPLAIPMLAGPGEIVSEGRPPGSNRHFASQ